MGKKTTIKKTQSLQFNSMFIATFSAWKSGKRTPTNGMIEPLLDYFGPKTKHITLLDAPHPGSSTLIPKVEEYDEGKLINTYEPRFVFPPLFILKRFNVIKTQPLFKIRDIVSVVTLLLSSRRSYDLYIGLESIYSIVGIIFKKLGKIKKVVYYVSDYSPHRYSSSIMNSIYLWLDRVAAYNADYIWDVSKAMMPARLKVGLDGTKSAPVIHVPNALFRNQMTYRKNQDDLEPYSLVFAGTIGPENGLDLAIEALALVKQKYPHVILHVFGGGVPADEKKARRLVKKLNLTQNVINHGFISDLSTLSNEISRYKIGLAPYRAIPHSVRWFADATKLRLYFACGLPVVSTHVPPLAHETIDCVIITQDTPDSFAAGIITLLTKDSIYKKMRGNAIRYARHNTWKNTYNHALSQMRT